MLARIDQNVQDPAAADALAGRSPCGCVDLPLRTGQGLCPLTEVSLFEKPKFRDLVREIGENEKERLSYGLREFLHGDQEFGFELMSGLLGVYKLAKWTLLTVCPVYYRANIEVFIKPNTAKGVIEYFELEGLKYSPKPTFEFYRAYREQINMMKAEVNASLQVDNGAFCGFLMMSM